MQIKLASSPAAALKQRFPDSTSCSVCPFPHSVELSPPPSVLLGSGLSSSPSGTQVMGEKHIWVVLQMCSTHSCAVDMGRCGPGQFGTTFSASILTSPEVFQCHNSGFSLIQQNSEALGVKHMFWP